MVIKKLLFDTKLNRFLNTSIDETELLKISIKNLKLIEDKLYASHDNGIIEINFEKLLNNETEIRFYEFNELLNRNIPRGFYDIEKIDSLLFVTKPLSGLWVFENDFSNFKNNLLTMVIQKFHWQLQHLPNYSMLKEKIIFT